MRSSGHGLRSLIFKSWRPVDLLQIGTNEDVPQQQRGLASMYGPGEALQGTLYLTQNFRL